MPASPISGQQRQKLVVLSGSWPLFSKSYVLIWSKGVSASFFTVCFFKERKLRPSAFFLPSKDLAVPFRNPMPRFWVLKVLSVALSTCFQVSVCSELLWFRTYGQAVPFPHGQEGGGSPTTASPAFQQASGTCQAEGPGLHHCERENKPLPCQGIILDQLHAERSLKTLPMLNLVNCLSAVVRLT